MSDAAPVEARFEPDGSFQPVARISIGGKIKLDSVARPWSKADGQHILVMSAGTQP